MIWTLTSSAYHETIKGTFGSTVYWIVFDFHPVWLTWFGLWCGDSVLSQLYIWCLCWRLKQWTWWFSWYICAKNSNKQCWIADIISHIHTIVIINLCLWLLQSPLRICLWSLKLGPPLKYLLLAPGGPELPWQQVFSIAEWCKDPPLFCELY